MRDIALIITMGEDSIITVGIQVKEDIALRMENSEEIKLRVMVKPKEDGNNSKQSCSEE